MYSYAHVLLKTISWRPHPSRSRRRWQRVSSCGGSNFLIGRTWGRRGGIGRVSLPNESSDASSAYLSRRRPSCNVDTCNSLHQLTLVYELIQITILFPWRPIHCITTQYVTKCYVERDCAQFFLRVPQACPGSRAKGSMAGTSKELSDISLQNLLNEAFCHLVYMYITFTTLLSIDSHLPGYWFMEISVQESFCIVKYATNELEISSRLTVYAS